jgi:general secretion pathway protein G
MNRTPPATIRAGAAGFTLVEIMVVIVILGLLATLVVSNIGGASDTARETKALADVKTLADAVRSYYAKKGRLPDSLQVLADKDEKGRSEIEDLPKDPWDRDYELRPGDRPGEWEVISLGKDGNLGTEDDISNRRKDK